MSKKGFIVNDEKALAWCHSLDANGIEIKMTWDGGNDSGWANIELGKSNLTDEECEFVEYLREKCYSELDYGSWAGEFSAVGEAVFDPIEEAFVGVDNYEEDCYMNAPVNIKVTVPATLEFDKLRINIEGEDIDVSTEFFVSNDVLTPEHQQAKIDIVDGLNYELPEVIKRACQVAGENFRYMYEEIFLTKDEFTVQGDQQVAVIETLSIGTSKSDPRDIMVSLKD